MKNPNRIAQLSAILLFVPLIAFAQRENTELDAKLAAPVSQYSLSANGLADALANTAKEFQLPIGIEWVKDKEALRDLRLTWKGVSVERIISTVVKEYPGYCYRVENGVVHVFRRDLVSDSHNFLNLKVPDSFEIREEIGGIANQRLQRQVQEIVSPRNLPSGAGEGGSYASGLEQHPLTLALRGANVREALEKLVDASEHKMWVVTFSDSSVLTPTGFRRTETLWHPTPFPDRDQPMWDFLAWEEYPPGSSAAPPVLPR